MKFNKLGLMAAVLALCLCLGACGNGGAPAASGSLAESSGTSSQEASGSEVSSGLNSSPLPEEQKEELHMMTVEETIEYFKSLDPAALGLSAKDMSAYNIYPSDKAIPVDGMPCMKVTAYATTESGNSPEATFLVARDGTAIYSLVDGEVTKLDLDL